MSQRIYFRKYEIPNPLNSLEEALQAQNLDLEQLSDVALYQEEVRAKMALASLDLNKQPQIFIGPDKFINVDEWLIQRIAAIRKERSKRQVIRE